MSVATKKNFWRKRLKTYSSFYYVSCTKREFNRLLCNELRNYVNYVNHSILFSSWRKIISETTGCRGKPWPWTRPWLAKTRTRACPRQMWRLSHEPLSSHLNQAWDPFSTQLARQPPSWMSRLAPLMQMKDTWRQGGGWRMYDVASWTLRWGKECLDRAHTVPLKRNMPP